MSTPYVLPDDETATQHDGTDSLAIKNTLLRRLLTRIALKTTARLYKHNGPYIPISKHLIVKTGPFIHLTKAATMSFVAANTSIPVPAIHCSFIHKNRAFIVIERIQGNSLAEAWPTLSDAGLDNIFAQLRQMFQELRALPPPPGTGVESCRGGSLRDSRIPRSRPRFGPFKYLRPEEQPEHMHDQEWKEIKEIVMFTHRDLNPFNILVRGGYIEYTSAWCGNHTRQAWQGFITQFLNPYPAELKIEKTRQR
ncbi:hypothetical protein BKA60DRAFT_601354 [Fusarium oxysporum]|nr:hypothetical protein BKA60DRAFT_601354 [Fusarium oxysporum]